MNNLEAFQQVSGRAFQGGTMIEPMQQAGLVLSTKAYRNIAQKVGNCEGFCWKCGKARQYTADELEKLMRNWPTCKNCKEKIHIRVK